MTEVENTTSAINKHDIQKPKHKKSESAKGLKNLLRNPSYDGFKSRSRNDRTSANLTQSSFFSKSTVASSKDPRPDTQSTILRSRGTATRFFTPKAHRSEFITAIDQASFHNPNDSSEKLPGASSIIHFDHSLRKRNALFSRERQQRTQVKQRFHSEERPETRIQVTETLPTETSETDTPYRKMKPNLSMRNIRSHASSRYIFREKSSEKITEETNSNAKEPGPTTADLSRVKANLSIRFTDKIETSPKTNQVSQSSITSQPFDRLRKDHSAFIKNNFRVMNFDRLKTFEKFAFTNIEREEHRDIVPILEDLRTYKERGGSMLVTDLWSKYHQKEVLAQCELLEEKNKLEKYAFYKVMQKKRAKKSEMQFPVMHNKNERVLKDILYRNQLKEEFLAKQNNELIEGLETKKKPRRATTNKLKFT